MSIPKRIEQKVYSGMILDEHGQWITMAEKINKELLFLENLEAGKVLWNGQWLPIHEALSQFSEKRKKKQTEPIDSSNNNKDYVNIPFPPETVIVECLDKDFPPETTAISIEENSNNKIDITKTDSLSSVSNSIITEETIAFTPDSYFKKHVYKTDNYQPSIVFNSKSLKNKKRKKKLIFYIFTLVLAAAITGLVIFY
jgi:hypothetical protein